MKLPRMSLHIGDYLKDTSHLDAAQSGAYLGLIMHYWATGGLPNDDKQLARIAKMTARQWTKNRSVIAAFFDHQWKHKRIDAEMQQAVEKYEKRAAAGKQGGLKKASNASLTLVAKPNQPLTLTKKKEEEDDARKTMAEVIPIVPEPPRIRTMGEIAEEARAKSGISPEAHEIARQIAIIECRVPEDAIRYPLQVQMRLEKGVTERVFLEAARRGFESIKAPPKKFKYYDPIIAEIQAEELQPLPVVKFENREKTNGRPRQYGKQNVSQMCYDAAAAIEAREMASANGCPPPRERSDESGWGPVIDVSECAPGSWGLHEKNGGSPAPVSAGRSTPLHEPVWGCQKD